MAKETRVGDLHIGTDFQYVFHVKNEAETAALNITGWALSFMIKRRKEDADAAALLTKTTVSGIVIAGTFNADPAVNTQRATVTIADTDTDGIIPGMKYYELKRTDAGFEAILSFGEIPLVRAVHRT